MSWTARGNRLTGTDAVTAGKKCGVDFSCGSLAEQFNSAVTADVTVDGDNGVLQRRDLIETAPGSRYTVADRARSAAPAWIKPARCCSP